MIGKLSERREVADEGRGDRARDEADASEGPRAAAKLCAAECRSGRGLRFHDAPFCKASLTVKFTLLIGHAYVKGA